MKMQQGLHSPKRANSFKNGNLLQLIDQMTAKQILKIKNKIFDSLLIHETLQNVEEIHEVNK